VRSRKIIHVQQKHDKGCVIACIAMVLGWEYDKVISEFDNDFNKKGTDTEIREVLFYSVEHIMGFFET
jgi:hypothetical protein